MGAFPLQSWKHPSSFPAKEHHVELTVIHQLFRSNALIMRVWGIPALPEQMRTPGHAADTAFFIMLFLQL